MSLNDMAMAAWSGYNLTTIHQPVADIIITAVELIVEHRRSVRREEGGAPVRMPRG